MVWWAAFPQRVAEGPCVHVRGEDLVTWLQARPSQIAPSRLDRVAEAVHAAWTPVSERPSADLNR
jgi:hypothetical protein